MYTRKYIVYRNQKKIGSYDTLALAQDKAEKDWDKAGGFGVYTIHVCEGWHLLATWTMMDGCDWV